MESNEEIELTRKMGTDSKIESRMTASGQREMMGIEKKEKGLMHMDLSLIHISEPTRLS